jgi:hypothetical protein
MWTRRVLFLGFLFMAGSTSAFAQTTRSGVWWSVGVTGGEYRSSPAHAGAVGRYVRVGGTINQHLLLGAEVSYWSSSAPAEDIRAGNESVSVLLYPAAKGRLFGKLGVGLAHSASTTHLAAGDGKMRSSGWGMTLGLGYDVRLYRGVSITPALEWLSGRLDDPWNDPRSARTVLITVGISGH